MSIKKNKLSLRTETLRTLTSPELEAAAGGNVTSLTTTTTATTRTTDTVKSLIGGCLPSLPLCVPTLQGCR